MKRIFLLTAVLFFMSCFSSLISSASDEGKVKKSLAPLNPAFLKYLKDKKEVKASSANGSVTGNVPVPLDLSHTKGRTPFTTPVSFPATYDLRDYNRVTSVKDQAGCGACWAFTAYGSLESCLMPGEETNFSEQDMIVNHGFDYSPCAGGHHFVSTAYLARWAGPLKESDFPYQYSNVSSGNEALVQKHIQETIFIPERSHYLDNDNIKHIIQTHGGVGMGFHVNQDSAYYNSTSAG
ncbi:MAG: hypothetical protein GY757_21165 [bacterium]|nr:hypothetical protein [bacterium]